jgi:hypothetical protein
MKPPRADADPKEMDPTPTPTEVPEPSDPVAPADPIEMPETEIHLKIKTFRCDQRS